MQAIRYTIQLHTSAQPLLLTPYRLTQGDYGAYRFVITLEEEEGFSAEGIQEARIVLRKLDGQLVTAALEKQEDGSWIHNVGTQELTHPGMVIAAVQFYGSDNQRITSGQFAFDVVRDLTNLAELVPSISEVDGLNQIMTDAKTLWPKLQAYADNPPIGPQGATGAKGDKGDTGATGAQGLQGMQGLRGATGAIGATGAKGDTGTRGEKGDTGERGATGAKGDKGDTGATGAQGVRGVQGLQGATGAIGATGAKGDTGAQGEKGDTGERGATGAKGDKGDTGATGPRGETGLRGEPGSGIRILGIYATLAAFVAEQPSATPGDAYMVEENLYVWDGALWQDAGPIHGLPGEKGDKGDTGATGAKGEPGVPGVTGAKGDKGDKGDTGATGAKGDAGAPGATGAKGEPGAPGAIGATGAQGAPGVTGAPGATGAKGDKGDKGDTGLKGDTGATGAKGDAGAPGATGAKGEPGTPGAQGAPGVTGAPGATGAKGDKGDTGDTGVKGDTGATGAKGEPGAPGLKGATGAQGAPGAQGVPGVTGAQGATGAKGDKGDKGDTGLKGDTGAPGAKGEPGAQGVPGATGAQGAQGVPGTPGAKGAAGAPGVTGAKGEKGDKGDPGTTAWGGISDKPATFPPTAHAHSGAEVAITPPSGMRAQNTQAAVQELFTFANSGKTGIASAIGAPMGVGNTFAELAESIRSARGDVAGFLSRLETGATPETPLPALAETLAGLSALRLPPIATDGFYICGGSCQAVNTTQTALSKLRSFRVAVGGAYRVYFSLSTNTPNSCTVQLYVNGAASGSPIVRDFPTAAGTVLNISSTALSVQGGDIVDFYLASGKGGTSFRVVNQVCFFAAKELIGMVLTN